MDPAPIAVVKLDDARYGAGPGTVLEVATGPINDIRVRYADRDGCVDARLRFWLAAAGTKIGDRVGMAPNP